MSLLKTLQSAVTSDGLEVSAVMHKRAGNLIKGARGIVEIAEEVHEEMSPEDDTPLRLTLTEGTMIALERFGVKLGN